MHLPTCDGCRDYYHRHLLLAEIDPASMSPDARIGRGLGFAPARSTFSFVRPLVGVMAATAAIALVFLWAPFGKDPTFTARGSQVESRLFVYQVTDGMPPLPVEGTIKKDAELAFAYDNAGQQERLLVFGVDEHQHVYWYHPAWLSADDNPIAISIPSPSGIHELPEAIRHELDGSTLVIYAIFTNKKVSVREIEERIRGGSQNDMFSKYDAVTDKVVLRVTR